MKWIAPLLAFAVMCPSLRAESGHAAWLRYAPIHDSAVRQLYQGLPAAIVTLSDSQVIHSAQRELITGVQSMLGRTLRVEKTLPAEDCILLATLESVKLIGPAITVPARLIDDAYFLKKTSIGGRSIILITAANDRGVLYGAFALLRMIDLHKPITALNETQKPYAPIRWTNEWDNLDGSIERGYAGKSIFFEDGNVVEDLTLASEYARLLSSVGINGCTVNNVNANPRVLSSEFLPQLVRLASVFRPWGVRLSISVDFSSPKLLGNLDTFDPLDPNVAAWWRTKADELYHAIPDLNGFLLKADSEGRVGPSTYGRSHADAANVIARALKPHGGVLVYRGFVYNHHMDWHDLKNDRARAAFDNFAKLDGQFDENVLIQIKHGPIDFQVREPVSPLLSAFKKTNETVEFQVTQEYTGQQRHLCFLLPMWKEVLDFDTRVENHRHLVKEVVAGSTVKRSLGGFVAVSNVGRAANWLGSDLAMANLYAFGRIAWDADLSSAEIVNEWTRLTFGHDAHVVDTINSLQLASWRIYEDYTGSLGVGGLTDIAGDAEHKYIGSHYGPGIESSERNGWGQWHRADADGVGMDRTVATGTGFIGQYAPQVASIYESLASCPDKLLLFMHHVAYSYVLHSGKTVIQHIYDSHYEGAAEAQTFPEKWRSLHGRVDDDRYQAILDKLTYQAGHAIVWRDTVCNWFFHESKIADSLSRVGHHPGRIEAETMQLDGYVVTDVTPWEDASGSKGISCPVATCSASTRFQGEPGWYDVTVQYFDQNNGVSQFRLKVGDQLIGEWIAGDFLPSGKPDSNSSTRRTFNSVALRKGDEIDLAGIPDKSEQAAIDYIEITPAKKR